MILFSLNCFKENNFLLAFFLIIIDEKQILFDKKIIKYSMEKLLLGMFFLFFMAKLACLLRKVKL